MKSVIVIGLGAILTLTACTTADMVSEAHTSKQAETPESKTTSDSNINIVINLSGGTPRDENLICEEFEVTGSRLKNVTSCHTKEQWEYIRNQTRINKDNSF